MEVDEIFDYALSLPHTEETTPFGPDTIVFKTHGKVFLLLTLQSEPIRMNYKANPDDIMMQREEYPDFIFPGYHMNKKHWNTFHINKSTPAIWVKQWIQNSYLLVQPKKAKKHGK